MFKDVTPWRPKFEIRKTNKLGLLAEGQGTRDGNRPIFSDHFYLDTWVGGLPISPDSQMGLELTYNHDVVALTRLSYYTYRPTPVAKQKWQT